MNHIIESAAAYRMSYRLPSDSYQSVFSNFCQKLTRNMLAGANRSSSHRARQKTLLSANQTKSDWESSLEELVCLMQNPHLRHKPDIDRQPAMNDQLTKKARKAVPVRYQDYHSPMSQTCMCWGFDHGGGMLQDIILYALNTGSRIGVIFSLRWQHVDLEKGLINMFSQKAQKVCVVPINRDVRRILEFWLLGTKNEFVFYNQKTGEPFVDLDAGLQLACEKAEISGVTWHTLRHTFASRLLERGVDIMTVKELKGHSSVTVTIVIPIQISLPEWLRWESWDQLLHQNAAVRIQNVANWPLSHRIREN
jgi:integrase